MPNAPLAHVNQELAFLIEIRGGGLQCGWGVPAAKWPGGETPAAKCPAPVLTALLSLALLSLPPTQWRAQVVRRPGRNLKISGNAALPPHSIQSIYCTRKAQPESRMGTGSVISDPKNPRKSANGQLPTRPIGDHPENRRFFHRIDVLHPEGST